MKKLWLMLLTLGLPHSGFTNSEFDFLLGEHDVTLHAWTGSNWTPPRPTNAEWHGRRGLRDLVIEDEWFDADPKNGNSGINVRMFDAEDGDWKMMWISSSTKQVQDLRAKTIDGTLTMWQVYPEREGWKAEFEVLSNCQWQRVDYTKNEDGWQRKFKLVASRRECG
ncbi:MAG: hypothetical protein GKR90_21690 [Pseudomonadales bacterium]|nr:hypothetical protein [Pseudomonadales bacterium]